MLDVRFRIPGVQYPHEADADRYLAAGAWQATTLGRALRRTAARMPAKLALVSDHQRLTFAEWDDASERFGAGLIALGLEPGHRVLIQMGTTIETAIALFGCFKSGIIPVCTLPQHRELEIGDISRQSQAHAHLVQADVSRFDLVGFAQRMAAAQPAMRHIIVFRGASPSGTVSFDALMNSVTLDDARQTLSRVEIGTADVVSFQLSGGTTGTPKIIPRFHAEYLGSATDWASRIGLHSHDTLLWSLPLIHNAGQVKVLVPVVLTGATLVLMPRMDPTIFFDWIERERVTVAASIGPVAVQVLKYAWHTRHDASSLRLFLTLSRAEALERHLGAAALNMFGMTEGLLMGSAPDDSCEARWETVGRPVAALDEVRLLALDGSDDEVPEGQAGELAFRGPSRTPGYFNMPEEGSRMFTPDGFYRSGDLMRARRIGSDLSYVFEGRLKDNIDRGGEKFGAEEIERLIGRFPGVADARVVAMPDPAYGERACAFLIMRPGQPLPGVDELGPFLLRQGLAKFKLPERIEPVDSLPVTRVGKVDRAALRARIARKLQEENG